MFVDIANFLRRFDSSTNTSLNNFDICLRAIHYMTKAFTLTVIIQVLRKKPFLFNNPNLYISRNLNFSVALYGSKTFKLETEH